MQKRHRELVKYAESQGLEFVEEESRRSGTFLTFKAANGARTTINCGLGSNAGGGGDTDLQSRLRSFARHNEPKVLGAALQQVLPNVEVREFKPKVAWRRSKLAEAATPPPPPPVQPPAPHAPLPPPRPPAPAPVQLIAPPAPQKDQPSEEKPMHRTSPTPAQRKNTTISQADFYRVCRWLESMPDLARYTSLRDVCVDAAQALGLTAIAQSTMETAYETVGKPKPRAPRNPNAPLNTSQVVARDLGALLKELGKDPSPELKAILERMGEL